MAFFCKFFGGKTAAGRSREDVVDLTVYIFSKQDSVAMLLFLVEQAIFEAIIYNFLINPRFIQPEFHFFVIISRLWNINPALRRSDFARFRHLK